MISLSLNFPPSVNNLYVNMPGRGRVVSPRYRAWKERALWEVAAQVRSGGVGGHVLVPGAFEAHLAFDRPDWRPRDLDNLAKACLDTLKGAGVIADDKHLTRLVSEWASNTPVKGARVRITVTPTAEGVAA